MRVRDGVKKANDSLGEAEKKRNDSNLISSYAADHLKRPSGHCGRWVAPHQPVGTTTFCDICTMRCICERRAKVRYYVGNVVMLNFCGRLMQAPRCVPSDVIVPIEPS